MGVGAGEVLSRAAEVGFWGRVLDAAGARWCSSWWEALPRCAGCWYKLRVQVGYPLRLQLQRSRRRYACWHHSVVSSAVGVFATRCGAISRRSSISSARTWASNSSRKRMRTCALIISNSRFVTPHYTTTSEGSDLLCQALKVKTYHGWPSRVGLDVCAPGTGDLGPHVLVSRFAPLHQQDVGSDPFLFQGRAVLEHPL